MCRQFLCLLYTRKNFLFFFSIVSCNNSSVFFRYGKLFFISFNCELSYKVFNPRTSHCLSVLFFFLVTPFRCPHLGQNHFFGLGIAINSIPLPSEPKLSPRRNGLFSKHLSQAPHKALPPLSIPRLLQSRTVQRRDLPREPAT